MVTRNFLDCPLASGKGFVAIENASDGEMFDNLMLTDYLDGRVLHRPAPPRTVSERRRIPCLGRQALETATHISHPCGNPDACARRQFDHLDN
jgi:hypothetical protein